VDDITSAAIMKALDALALRQSYTAQNIANAGSPGYKPVRVTFEDSLRAAAREGIRAINDVAPKTEIDPADAGSSSLRLDLELATAAQTAKRYGALAELLSRQMALRHAMITEGRR
jgi:flagellar basal-body rod protein FlgB